MDVDHSVGILQAHFGALVFAVAVLKVVHDGVFDAICDIAGMGKLVAVGRDVDGEGPVEREDAAPVIPFDFVVELIGIFCLKAIEWLEDTQCGAATEVCLVHYLKVAVELHHPSSGQYVCGSKVAQFPGEHLLKPLECLCDHREIVVHYFSILFGCKVSYFFCKRVI